LSKPEDFVKAIADGYATEGAAIELGRGVHAGELHADAVVRIPLAMMNRHGLVAGATGTGKTRTLQLLAEALSAAGVPVFAADVKGDLSGMAVPGEAGEAAEKRQAELGLPFAPQGFPTEYLALGTASAGGLVTGGSAVPRVAGVPVRATVSDFGPQLLGKVLSANKTQEQSLALVFHYADQNGLPLVDLADLRALLTFLDSDEGKPELKRVGGLSPATVGVLLRSLIGLEEGGGTELFGEPQFAIADLLRTAPDGRGVISCLELPGVQDEPALFSTALMWLLAELFEDLPEAGDLDKPKLVFFFDEAHLLFADATDAFLDSIARTVRLIRSKGVGIFFVTQNPQDLPAEVLGQLGSRIQHALRAFTPDDAKALRATVSTYPKSEFYDLEELLGQMGIGEAAVTVLSDRGIPTPVVHTRLAAPAASMGPAPDVDGAAKASPLFARYGERLDNRSAREVLEERLVAPAPLPPTEMEHVPVPKAPRRQPAPAGPADVGDFLRSREGQRLQRKVLRGVFGMLRKRL
jgi:DNA helicase HerA-like ATPase